MIVEAIITQCRTMGANCGAHGAEPPVLSLPTWLGKDMQELAGLPDGELPHRIADIAVIATNDDLPNFVFPDGRVEPALQGPAAVEAAQRVALIKSMAGNGYRKIARPDHLA